ncbi:gem-associated protein 8 [Rhineura floridana]|uniref:gem-associated protein 8 n=1 Tax=Rhineura floridana TaxID=261503 RepID=UPI002AC82B21|nr:gem-associated protein 8 [Rhineura floridana]XP_061483137.1 gem-associated protein 8 [Rhineura floridana]XP_061483138.1 gem-associated protein 8 [Rhineura floridana]
MGDSVPQEKGPWYSQKVYARYWKHYNQAMEWMYRHQNAYRKAMESLYNLPFCPSENHSSRRYPDWDEGDPLRAGSYQAFTQGSKAWLPPEPQHSPHNTSRREEVERDSEMETESEDERDIEYDLSNMEITEELRQYFEQTERHREELRKQQQLEAEHQATYVEADHDLHLSTGRSVQPPSEKPGKRRVAEMKKLYGVSASKIQAMETSMQLSFDRNCDKKQPKYWPIIPLKL